VQNKRGRGAGTEMVVLGLLKQDNKVYTEIIPNVTKTTLRAVIRRHANLASVIHTDG
jgi:transposase